MYQVIKRFFDIVFSLVAIVLLLPVFIPVIILLLLTGEHEVFYKQDRGHQAPGHQAPGGGLGQELVGARAR